MDSNDKKNLKVSFLISSIDLFSTVTDKIKPDSMIRLNITQKPILIKEEYIVDNINKLKNINHEFVVVNDQDSMKELTLTLRKVEKKRCLSNSIKKSHENKNLKRNNSCQSSSNIQYKYNQNCHSLLGYFTINIQNFEKEVQQSLQVDIITKNESIVIGHANIEIFKCDEMKRIKSANSKKNKINTMKNNNYHYKKTNNVQENDFAIDDPNCYLLA